MNYFGLAVAILMLGAAGQECWQSDWRMAGVWGGAAVVNVLMALGHK